MPIDVGQVKPHVQKAADEIAPLFGIKNVGGWRAQGSVPDSDHPKGLALDFMTRNRLLGDAIVAYVIANANRLGVTYVIWWGRIWFPGKGWSDYGGPSDHKDHVHVSFGDQAGSGPVVSPVGLPGIGNIPVLGQLESFAETLMSRDYWIRVGKYLVGIALLMSAVYLIFRRPINATVTTVVPQAKALKGGKR